MIKEVSSDLALHTAIVSLSEIMLSNNDNLLFRIKFLGNLPDHYR